MSNFSWENHKNQLRGKISKKAMDVLDLYANNDNIGFESGQLRPGELGQWDLYYNSQEWNLPENERRLISGLPDSDFQQMEIEQRQEQFQLELVRSMSQPDLVEFVDNLEKSIFG